ncbi:MAG: efflux transporter outer membrane subunit [Opitutales bacterium]|nr:efflux transporter outer membrane subunit [Opitutales bacterium]
MTNKDKFAKISRGALAASALALGACTLEPEYKIPETPLDAQAEQMKEFKYAEGLWTQASPNDGALKGEWWRIFGDEELSALIKSCREKNPDLKSAFYAVEQARQKARMTEAELYPWANANAGWTKTGTSKNEFAYRGTFEDYRIGLGLTWDLDLFGRVQALMASEVADAQALRAAYENTMLVLEASVANAYFNVRQCNSEILLLNDTVKVREKQVELVTNRAKAKYAHEADVKRSQQQYYEALTQLAAVEKQRDASANLLAYLAGTIPSKLAATAEPIPEVLPKVPAIIPSQLLERRPDIASAEREVYAANMKIGAATSAFFPTIQITSSLDLASQDISDLIKGHSLAWGVSPRLYLPIFQAGRLYAQYQVALAQHQQAAEKYKATVLNAIYEVENALSAIKHLENEYEARAQSAAAAKAVEELTRRQFDSGVIDYFEYTDAERLALANERERIRLRGDQFRSVISLVLAIGGGAEEESKAE